MTEKLEAKQLKLKNQNQASRDKIKDEMKEELIVKQEELKANKEELKARQVELTVKHEELKGKFNG